MTSGFLLIDKPAGMTSFHVIRIARKKLGIKKMGHAGTLDPFATGLLVLAVNEGTKALSHLLASSKVYRTKIVFGITSDTLDIEGEIQMQNQEQKKTQNIASLQENLEELLPSFVGKITQIPPKYSALKINGKRACDRVRAGEEVEIKSRETELFSAELLGIEEQQIEEFFSVEHSESLPSEKFFVADIRIHVKTGFYVRSFARDLGEKLGTSAMCLTLRRESIDEFSVTKAIFPDDIILEKIFPVEPHYFSFPAAHISSEQKEEFFHGRAFPFSATEKGEHSIFCEKKWIGFGTFDGKNMQPKKVAKNT